MKALIYSRRFEEHTNKLQHQLTIPPQVLGATTHYLRLYFRRRGPDQRPASMPATTGCNSCGRERHRCS